MYTLFSITFHKIPFAKFDNLNYYNVPYQNLLKSSFCVNQFIRSYVFMYR